MTVEMHDKPFILLVEDDRVLRGIVADNLEAESYHVMSTGLAQKAGEYMTAHDFDLIVLDLNLPDGSGIDLCRRWRSDGVTAMILMLTARDTEQDMLAGFEAGADDYIVKPYPMTVLLHRIAALLRRRQNSSGTATPAPLELPGFRLDVEARQLFRAGGQEEIALTRIEYDLLLYLINNQNRAVSYDEILADVWGGNIHVVQGAIRNCISSIRKKLEHGDTDSRWRIVTLRGVGYRLETA